jgi:hypothetical protein
VFTSSTTIGLTWSQSTNNGGSAIIDYAVWCDQAIGNWVMVVSGITTYSYTVTGLTSGLVYQFKIQSRNDLYWSEFSEIITVQTAQYPA